MPILAAENNFRRGLAALVDDNHQDAVVFFGRALEIERQRNQREPEPRYLSYYGLSLARARPLSSVSSGVPGTCEEALEACRRAASTGCPNPDLFVNLGRVHLLAGHVSEAARSFERGLAEWPAHPVLLRELARIDRRRRPLPGRRNHAINRLFGRLRAALTG